VGADDRSSVHLWKATHLIGKGTMERVQPDTDVRSQAGEGYIEATHDVAGERHAIERRNAMQFDWDWV